MQMTITEAATRLGKTLRQVRYLIRTGRLPARKVAGRWVLESADLPLSSGQREAGERKQRGLRAAVDAALSLEPQGGRYSVRKLKAFQAVIPIYATAGATFGAEHAVTRALADVAVALARGCHRFEAGHKITAYREAREHASTALAYLALTGAEDADALLARLEQELLPAITGLLSRLERRRR